MCKCVTLTMAGVILAWGSVALAEGPPRPGAVDRDALLERGFTYLDANGDGQIDRTEFHQQMPQVVRRILGGQRQRHAGRAPMGGRGFGPGKGARGRRHGRGGWGGAMGGRFGQFPMDSGRGRAWRGRARGPCAMGLGRGPGAMGRGRRGAGMGPMGFAGGLDRMIEAKVERAVRRAMDRLRSHGMTHSPLGRGQGRPPGKPDRPRGRIKPPHPPGAGPSTMAPARPKPDDLEPFLPRVGRRGPPDSPRARGGGGRGRGPGMGRRGMGRPGGPPPVIRALDVNGDGQVDLDELGRAVNSLKKLDGNRDGVLDARELGVPPPPGQGEARPSPPGGRDRGPARAGRGPKKKN